MIFINQPVKKDKSEEFDSKLKLLEIRGNIIKSLAWPLLALLFYIFNFGAINNTIKEIPFKFSKSDKFAMAGLSFEISRKAAQQGIPELATLAKGLSADEIEFILTTGNQIMRFSGSGKSPNEVLLDLGKKREILNELLEKGLVDLSIPMDEYLNYFRKNDIKEADELNGVKSYELTDEQMKNNLDYIESENYVLSTKGKRLFSLVIEVVAESMQGENNL